MTGRGTWLLSSQKNVTPLKLTWNPSKSRVEIKLRYIFLYFSHKTIFLTTGVGRWFSQKTDISPVSYLLSIFPTRTCRGAHNWAALQYWCAAWSRHLRSFFLFLLGWWSIKNLRSSLWGLFIDIFDMIISIQPLPDIPRFPIKRLFVGWIWSINHNCTKLIKVRVPPSFAGLWPQTKRSRSVPICFNPKVAVEKTPG